MKLDYGKYVHRFTLTPSITIHWLYGLSIEIEWLFWWVCLDSDKAAIDLEVELEEGK